MAHKKGGGTTKNGRDSSSKRLGLKIFGNSFIKKGQIIIRQRGNTINAGINVGTGRDYTLYALENGFLKFYNKNKKKYVKVL